MKCRLSWMLAGEEEMAQQQPFNSDFYYATIVGALIECRYRNLSSGRYDCNQCRWICKVSSQQGKYKRKFPYISRLLSVVCISFSAGGKKGVRMASMSVNVKVECLVLVIHLFGKDSIGIWTTCVYIIFWSSQLYVVAMLTIWKTCNKLC